MAACVWLYSAQLVFSQPYSYHLPVPSALLGNLTSVFTVGHAETIIVKHAVDSPTSFPQVIAQPDERYESYCRGCDFIREHIFPGGHLPSMGAMVEAARGTQVSVLHRCRDPSVVTRLKQSKCVAQRMWTTATETLQQGFV